MIKVHEVVEIIDLSQVSILHKKWVYKKISASWMLSIENSCDREVNSKAILALFRLPIIYSPHLENPTKKGISKFTAMLLIFRVKIKI